MGSVNLRDEVSRLLIIAMVDAGYSDKEIAEETGILVRRIADVRRKAGIVRR